MIDKRPLLSIVVPTKDRYKYLKHLIELIDSFNSNEIELVIQDNTENNKEFVEFLNFNNFSFIRYAHRKEQIPVSLNADLAILNSTGKYVSMIGDDDGVSRKILKYVRWMDKNDIDSLRPQVAIYKWPGVKGYVFDFSSIMQYSKPTKKVKYITNFDKVRSVVLKQGAITQDNLPRIYCGIVKREILDIIYNTTNSYFPGPSPDMASAIALSFCVRKHAIYDVPLIIAGHSPKSAGGMGTAHKHVAEIKDVPWLPKSTEADWEKTIPKYWTGQTIYADSAIKSLRRMGKEEWIKQMNFSYLYAAILIFDPILYKKNKQFVTTKNIIPITWYYIQLLVKRGGVFISNFLKKRVLLNNLIIKENINTINECEAFIFENLS